MPNKSAVNLAYELSTILESIEGIEILAHRLQEPADPGDAVRVKTTAGVSAALSLVALRLADVIALVRGDIDAGLLLADHNRVRADKPGAGIIIAVGGHQSRKPRGRK